MCVRGEEEVSFDGARPLAVGRERRKAHLRRRGCGGLNPRPDYFGGREDGRWDQGRDETALLVVYAVVREGEDYTRTTLGLR